MDPGDTGGTLPSGLGRVVEPRRVLPKLSHHPELPLPSHGLPETDWRTNRPTAADLHAEGVVGVGWEYFSPAERKTARFLAEHGVELVSVRARGNRRKTPDALIPGPDVTVEMKSVEAASVNAVRGRLRFARRQSGRVVIDGRAVGLTDALAHKGLAAELNRRGGDFDEVMILVADGRAISWP